MSLVCLLTADSMYMWYTIFSTSAEKMKAYSIEFRKKIVKAYEQGDTSVRKVATRFDVSKAFVQKILKQKQTTGHVQPKKRKDSGLKKGNELRPSQVTRMGRNSLTEKSHY